MTAGRRVAPVTLIATAVELIKNFNPATQTVDSYADDTLDTDSKTGQSTTSKSDVVFLKQVRKSFARTHADVAP